MKKFSIVAVLAIMAVAFTGCGNSAPKANLKNDVDTLTYAMGMLQSQGLKDYLVGRMGMDTTYMDEFFRGLNDGANAGDDKAKAAYYAGIQIGQQVANNMIKGINHEVYGEDSTKSISLKNFLAGFIASTAGQKTLFTDMEAQVKVQTLMPIVRSKRLMKEYAPNKEAAAMELDNLERKWGGKYPYAILSWRKNWDDLTVFFQFPLEIRSIIYTTNLIENLNGKIRKYTKSKLSFPSDDAVKKTVYLSLMEIEKKWTQPIHNWGLIMNQFMLMFENRIQI